MFKSNQRLMNRWRLDHKLSDLDRIERWIVWDLLTEEQVELLTLSAVEHIQSAQPALFLDVHQSNQDCIHAGLEDTSAYAIYPLGTSEFTHNTTLDPQKVLNFLAAVYPLLEHHGHRLYPSEITIHEGVTKLRPLGQTIKHSKINVNPLDHPDVSNPYFSLAMMVVCSFHPDLNFSTNKAFIDWISGFTVDTWLPDIDQQASSWIDAAIHSTPLPLLPAATDTVKLSPIQIEAEQQTPLPHSQHTVIANARRDVPLPTYLLCTAAPSSPSTAKQIAAISHVPLAAALDAHDHKKQLIIDGANTLEAAQSKLKRYENLPITISILDKRGIFSHMGVRHGFTAAVFGGLLLTGLGFGFLPVAIGAGVWSIGRILQTRQIGIQDQLWKAAQQVGLKQDTDVMMALQAARNRVLLSDLPSLAIAELLKEIDRLDDMATTAPQQAIDLANQVHAKSGNIDTAIKKSLQQTEDLVKSSIQ